MTAQLDKDVKWLENFGFDVERFDDGDVLSMRDTRNWWIQVVRMGGKWRACGGFHMRPQDAWMQLGNTRPSAKASTAARRIVQAFSDMTRKINRGFDVTYHELDDMTWM